MEWMIIIIALVLIVLLFSKLRSEIYTLRENQERSLQILSEIKKQLGKLQENQNKKDTSQSVSDPKIDTVFQNIPIATPEIEKKKETIKEIEKENIPTPTPTIIPERDTKGFHIAQPSVKETKPLPKEPTLSWFEKFRNNNPDFEKFIGENLINKIGILILVLGISFFVKYAIDKNWINEPARVGIGILCGAILLVIAHKLRKKYKAFSSIFVAGAIAVFYFTIGIAYHDYQLFSQTAAFVIMVVITIFSTFVALAYDRQELFILSTIGGFAVPFMVSNGTGNYHALFIYLILLNVGMLVITFYKRWFLVNFISFVLTIAIFSTWFLGTDFKSPVIYNYALLYISIIYFIFSIAFLLHSIIRKTKIVSWEMSAFIMNSAVYYAFGISIFRTIFPNYQGLFTLIIGVYNLVYAFVLFKKYKFDFNVIYVLLGLALTFGTITIPIQFNGNYITILWACESVLLFWLTKKSNMKGFAFVGMIVQVLAIISLFIDWNVYNNYNTNLGVVFLNKIFITGLTVIASIIVVHQLLKSYKYFFELFKKTLISSEKYTQISLIVAIILGYIVPFLDIAYFAKNAFPHHEGDFWIWIYLFHILYTSAFVYWAIKKGKFAERISFIVVGFNTILYIVLAYRIPIIEKFDSIIHPESKTLLAFFIHYISLAGLIFQLLLVRRKLWKDTIYEFFQLKISPWFWGFIIVYVFSVEVNILLTTSTTTIDAYYYYRNIGIKVFFPILWGVISFLFLVYGIKKNRQMDRIVALVLLGLTVLKLFAYDIKEVSETGKIIAFILLGALILTISFVYQKIKKIVIDNNGNDKL